MAGPLRWVVAALLLSGCSGPAVDPDSDGVPQDPEQGAEDAQSHVAAPILQVGQAWTYRTAGYWDHTTEVTVVVARADAQGYLLAGAQETDLADEVAWDRAYFGAFDLAMRPSDGGTPGWVQFPLADGATWSIGDVPVTATAGNVSSPVGDVPGFIIRGETANTRIEVDYAPSMASVTHYARHHPGQDGPADTLDLVSTGTQTSWVTLERGDEAYYSPVFGDPAEVATLQPGQIDVTAEDDVVYVWAIADVGARVAVHTGGANTWTFDGHGSPNFGFEAFPASPGAWTVTAAPGDVASWAYVQLHAIRYVAGP
jgi:prepilin-type processing-associated H-X9-DG protein